MGVDAGSAVTQMHYQIVDLVCGPDVNGRKMLRYSEFGAPPPVESHLHFLRLRSYDHSVLYAFKATTLYVEAFQVDNGTVYLIGNKELENHYKECQDAKTDPQARRSRRGRKRLRGPDVLHCLDNHRLKTRVDLRIGDDYNSLEAMAGIRRSEMMFGKNGLREAFNKLVNFQPEAANAYRDVSQAINWFITFFIEPIRFQNLATEMTLKFTQPIDSLIPPFLLKLLHLWGPGSNILRNRDSRVNGVPEDGKPEFTIQIEGRIMSESELSTLIWVLKRVGDNVYKDRFLDDTTRLFNLDSKYRA